MKIAIGLSFYEDYKSLRRMLQSLEPYPVDLIIAVDGKYKEWSDPTAPNLSNAKRVLDTFRSFRIPFRYVGIGGLTQIEKRTLYFEYCNKEDIDVLIVMDSDEYIIEDKTNWSLFTKDLEQKIKTNNTRQCTQSYSIPIQGYDIQGDRTESTNNPTHILKAFYKPSELEYHGNHYTIRNRYTKLIQGYAGDVRCEHIMIGHDHALRDPERLKQMDEYEKVQMRYEKEGRYK